MRTRISFLAALVVLALAVPPAFAAPPGPANDEPNGAIAVTSLPYSNSQSTSKATANDADGGCGAGGVDQATVWYTITVESDARVLIDTTGSSYVTGINIFADAPGGEILDCLEDTAIFDAAAGHTYHVMIADIDGDRNGGRLDLSISEGPPPISIGITLDPAVGFDAATGTISVSGTVTCTADSDSVEVFVEARQTSGRFIVRGFGFNSTACTAGEDVAWTADIVGETGTFGFGSTVIDASAFGCDFFSCGDAFATQTVRIRR